MCGITGFIDFTHSIKNEEIEGMTKTLQHRGPDSFGYENYHLSHASIGFGQTRLAIIDVSPGGHQPMHYEHVTIVFNGEIYNYREIKDDLYKAGHVFKSTSDTEVILHAYAEWGDKAVEKFIGMFVFAILDKREMKVKIFRDRAGVKPIYYFNKNGLFLFGSELKALMNNYRFEKIINKSVMPTYLQYGYIPAPHSIFENCYKILPGNILTVDLESQNISSFKYWDVKEFYCKPKLNISFEEAKQITHDLLKSVCNYRMVSDVPVGVFLSGGYDSTAITSIIQSQRSDKLKTFTIGLYDGVNEAKDAKRTAEFLGTDHYELYCTFNDAENIIHKLPYYYDEPFADSSAIPTILVSQLARRHVKVALSADGGDEVFCGYSVYSQQDKFMKILNSVPSEIKPALNNFGTFIVSKLPYLHEATLHKTYSFFKSLHKNEIIQSVELFHLLNEKPYVYMKKYLKDNVSNFISPYIISENGFQHPIDVIMATDYLMYFPNDILTKVDRATMSVSLEGREPLTDHRLIELAAQLPVKYKYDGNSGKIILKEIVHNYVPKEMMDRPKTGFTIPINTWLRNELGYLIDEYLNYTSLQESGIFNEKFVLEEVGKFKNKKMHYSTNIWYILMFQMWYKEWML